MTHVHSHSARVFTYTPAVDDTCWRVPAGMAVWPSGTLAPTDLPLWEVESAWDGKPVALVGASMGDTGHGARPVLLAARLCLFAWTRHLREPVVQTSGGHPEAHGYHTGRTTSGRESLRPRAAHVLWRRGRVRLILLRAFVRVVVPTTL